MTVEELNGRIGLGVQAADGSMRGALRSVHGTCAVITLEDGRVVWLPADKIVAWDKPVPAAEEARPQPEPAAPAEAPAPVREHAEPVQEHAESVREHVDPAPTAAALVPEHKLRISFDYGGIMEVGDGTGVDAYDVSRYGWTVIYDGRLRRVLWVVPERRSLVLDVDGQKVEVELDSDDLE